MTPMPPSSASATAIAARVTVSMLAETSGRRSAIPVENRPLKINLPGVAPIEDAVLRAQQEVVERPAVDEVGQQVRRVQG